MPLSTLLRLNAVSCLGFGCLFVFFAIAVSGFLGDPPVWVLRCVGAGLVLNGILILISAARGAPRSDILFFSLGDFGWVVATAALLIADLWITTTSGQIAAVVVAVWVGGLGVLQWRGMIRGAVVA